MSRTIGYHIVWSGYGLWLPGDERGYWSEAWDEQLGYIEPHTLHSGDPVRLRMAEERMQHPPVRLDALMIGVVADVLGKCSAESEWRVAAAAIEATHLHLLLTFTERDIDNSVKWLKDQTTKAIHRGTPHVGPVWCKGRWRQFMFDEVYWRKTREYIEQHNERKGLPRQPYAWVTPLDP
jgi:REP element-mobilizing transposase RayT